MNEESSKFVDVIALEKLLKEKLGKVNHSPEKSLFKDFDYDLNNSIGNCNINLSEVSKNCLDKITYYKVPSYFQFEHYLENNDVYLYSYTVDNSKGNILLIHGLYDDNLINYNFLIRLLNKINFSVYIMILPYHYNRKPESSLYSGEFFFSADVYRTVNAFKQAVIDVDISLQFIESLSIKKTMILGFSMGAAISFRYYLLKDNPEKVFMVNPVTELTKLVWDCPLLSCVKRDLDNCDFDMDLYEEVFQSIDPCENINENFDNTGLAMVYSIYDQVIGIEKYKKFIKKVGIEDVYEYSSGHLNVLRVLKLSKDIDEFFKKTEKK